VARDGVRLKAWWFQPAASNGGCVVVLHGVSDSKVGSAGFAPMFLQQGYSVLAPDSRSHGESGGEFITYGLLEKYDVVAWARWMRGRGCSRIYGLGESLGASILIQASGLGPDFSAIVAESAFADLREMAVLRMGHIVGAGFWANSVVGVGTNYARFVDGLDFRLVAPKQSMLSAAPVLLIHGLDDERTPAEQSMQLAAVRPLKDSLWLVPRGGHTSAAGVAPVEFRERVLRWFAEH
jgi:dipeptidyl aminopeptidase/acylaminoacyl peptidase